MPESDNWRRNLPTLVNEILNDKGRSHQESDTPIRAEHFTERETPEAVEEQLSMSQKQRDACHAPYDTYNPSIGAIYEYAIKGSLTHALVHLVSSSVSKYTSSSRRTFL